MTRGLPIRWKLLLLAGVPVLGAILLSIPVIREAQEDARKARALGSVENVAQLNTTLGVVIRQLQTERARMAAAMGRNAARLSDGDSARDDDAAKLAAWEQSKALAVEQGRRTDEAIAALTAIVEHLQESELPPRLALHLGRARTGLSSLRDYRKQLDNPKLELASELDAYGAATSALIAATAALNEMTDDGELLRTITVLVAVLEEMEAASVEHATLAYVFTVGEFPPGSYRTLVTRITEQDAHAALFRTLASAGQQEAYQSAIVGPATAEARGMRAVALKAVEDEVRQDPSRWFEVQNAHVEAIGRVAGSLNDRVKTAAVSKAQDGRRNMALGVGLSASVLFASVLLALVIGRGISSNVSLLTAATSRVAKGDLESRVGIRTRDELGALGDAFDKMTRDVAAARTVLEEKSRMARELEIAASIQRAVLPTDPRHPDFQFSGRMIPADEVGGDFYDVLSHGNPGELWLAIGDVSNHGIEAGLVMLMAQAAIASHFEAMPGASPDDVLRRVNRVLQDNIVQRRKDDKYLTAQVLTYVGAGLFRCAGAHTWPLVYRAASGRCEVLETSGPWLGIVPELSAIPVTDIQLQPGDVLCLYSDGLTESRDDNGNLFDLDGLTGALERAAGSCRTVDEMADAVIESVKGHAVKREDDWTVLLVQRASEDARG